MRMEVIPSPVISSARRNSMSVTLYTIRESPVTVTPRQAKNPMRVGKFTFQCGLVAIAFGAAW